MGVGYTHDAREKTVSANDGPLLPDFHQHSTAETAGKRRESDHRYDADDRRTRKEKNINRRTL